MTPGADKSREAAEECSPRRKAWGKADERAQPQRGGRKFSARVIVELRSTGQQRCPAYDAEGTEFD